MLDTFISYHPLLHGTSFLRNPVSLAKHPHTLQPSTSVVLFLASSKQLYKKADEVELSQSAPSFSRGLDPPP